MHDILKRENYTWLKYYLKSDIPYINLNYIYYVHRNITRKIFQYTNVCIYMYIIVHSIQSTIICFIWNEY